MNHINFNSTVVRLKPVEATLYSERISHFNSTVVRLNLFLILIFLLRYIQFQFYCSAIKTRLISQLLQHNSNFNSTVVRLKLCKRKDFRIYITDFNSTVVRLKPSLYPVSRVIILIFQFYCSAIKTRWLFPP